MKTTNGASISWCSDKHNLVHKIILHHRKIRFGQGRKVAKRLNEIFDELLSSAPGQPQLGRLGCSTLLECLNTPRTFLQILSMASCSGIENFRSLIIIQARNVALNVIWFEWEFPFWQDSFEIPTSKARSYLSLNLRKWRLVPTSQWMSLVGVSTKSELWPAQTKQPVVNRGRFRQRPGRSGLG